ncbi:hypothetical protein [Acinetobacter terrestris]|uniref:Uncharacterized protein n=1 Tax=Acinetobacter terrestris TaxID=2529843 RepID=A0AAW6UQC5_9GAMM|nr:hypothetical protein [Acinetobacter terrestris]MDK1683513.1 hypothetical protein [Acinetobacter terrestris]
MKANEFVQEHGLPYTRNLVRGYPNHTHVTDDGRMFINENTCVSHIKVQLNELVKMDDLKRLVESHEVVMDYYGLTRAKEHAESNYTAPELKAALKQAIADVEACEEIS